MSRSVPELLRTMPSRTPIRRALPALLAAAVLAVVATSAAAGQPPSPGAAPDAQAVAERETLGLPTDPATLTALGRSGADVGTAMWGIPMTAVEEQAVDILGRMTYVHELNQELLPYVRALQNYAGAYIDPAADGSLVVMLTSTDPLVERQIRALLPTENRGLTIARATYTEVELRAAAEQAWSIWAEVSTSDLSKVSVDTVRNGLTLTVAPADFPAASASVLAAESRLGVPVQAEPGAPDYDTVCTDRDHCHTPMRGGIVIRNDTDTGGGTCTMAFHIRIGSDEQFLTAGHCGCAYSPIDCTTWATGPSAMSSRP